MKLTDLESAVSEHSGVFVCEKIREITTTKTVPFKHVVTEPGSTEDIPDVGRLRDVYDTFGSILFYSDEQSGDAARFLAPPSDWEELYDEFYLWVEDVMDEEVVAEEGDEVIVQPVIDEEPLPEWVESCLAIGEVPNAGNFILMATEGPQAGQVFEFDHDGQKFTHEANDLVEYIHKLIAPDSATLIDLATYMRFIDSDDTDTQWWIREMSDNRGQVVRTVVVPVVPVLEG